MQLSSFAVLILAITTTTAQEHITTVCNTACDQLPLHKIFNASCHKICESTVGIVSKECDASLASWSNASSVTGAQARFSSANLVGWFDSVAATLEQALELKSDPAAVKDMAMQVVIKGFLKDFGKYDQCVAVDGAHYCPTSIGAADASLAGGLSVGVLGLCLPATCSANEVNDLWYALTDAIGTAATLDISAMASFTTTCGEQSVGWDAGTVIMVIICFLIALLVLLATAVEAMKPAAADSESNAQEAAKNNAYQSMSAANQMLLQYQSTLGMRLLGCFSLFKNIKKFGEIRSGTATSCLDGVRTMSMCWVVMGHTLLWPLTSNLPGYSNMGELAPYYNKDALLGSFGGQAILSAEFSVDSFFFMSGFLATYIGIKKLGEHGFLKPIRMAPFMYLDRFLRLTPCYFFILLCYTYISPLLATGPFWSNLDQDACKENWWKNLLYVQTIFDAFAERADKACYGVSWYLADDMMYFYAVPFLVALALWKRAGAYVAMLVLSIGSIIAGFVISHHYTLSPSPFDPTGTLYMAKYYYPPWTRMAPYLMGTAFGLFWRDHQKRAIEFLQDKRVQLAVWLVAAVILGSCTWGNASALQEIPSKLYTDRVRGDIFVALAKPAWTLGLGLVCMLCFARLGGVVQWFLEAPIFGYCSKLTFTVYLIHPTILFIWVRSITGPLHYSPSNYALNFLGILSSSAALAFVIHLCVEQPTSNLLSILMAPKKRPPKSETDGPDSSDDDDNGILGFLPLPFEGESAFLALPAPANLMALPAPMGQTPRSSRNFNQLAAPLAGLDLENGKSIGNLAIA